MKKCVKLVISKNLPIGMLKEAMVNLNKAGKNMRLTINIQKSQTELRKNKYVVFKVYGQEFEMRGHLKYFGSVLTEDNNVTSITKRRTVIANRTSYGLEKQLSS